MSLAAQVRTSSFPCTSKLNNSRSPRLPLATRTLAAVVVAAAAAAVVVAEEKDWKAEEA